MKKILPLLLALLSSLTIAQTFPVQNLQVNGESSFSGGISGSGVNGLFAMPPAIGASAANSGAFTTLSASGASVLTGAVSGAGAAALVSFTQVGTGAVTAPLQTKSQQVVHIFDFMSSAQVSDYKACGKTLDDSASLQAAIASLPATGGTVRLGRGCGLLSSAVTISGPGHYQIIGEGASEASNNNGATELIKGAALTTAALVINSPNAKLQDFVLRGASGNTGDGVQLSGNSDTLENVSVYSMGQDGVRIGLDTGTNANSWSLIRGHFSSNTRHGVKVSDLVSPTLPNANSGTWLNSVAQSNGGDGVRIDNATLNAFVGGTYEGNTGAGLRFSGAGANFNTVLGGDSEANTAGDVIVASGSLSNAIRSMNGVLDTGITDSGTATLLDVAAASGAGWFSKGIYRTQFGNPGGPSDVLTGAGGGYTRFIYGGDTISDANSQIIVASNGLHLGKSTSGLVGFFSATPVAQSTGWGAPTGGVLLTNFPGASATLPQTSAQVAQILLVLKSYGLIGN